MPDWQAWPMRFSPRVPIQWLALVAALVVPVTVPASWASAARPARPAGPVAGPVTQVSKTCTGTSYGNAEPETASGPAHDYLYDVWISCRWIAFSRSADAGKTWSTPARLPVPPGATVNAWDPSIAVSSAGTVYAAFMAAGSAASFPVVDISVNHGASFRVSKVFTPTSSNFGDRDFVAVGSSGEIYVTWDYGPDRQAIQEQCFSGGSCSFSAGDLNAVLQESTDGGRTWSKIRSVAPGFPRSGSISAPVLVAPGGRIDVLFERYRVTNPTTLTLGSGHEYFTSSGDHGRTWTKPVRLGYATRTLSNQTWWIDGSLGMDSAGNLYATWDTQSLGHDVGWLSYSVTVGRTWSPPVRVTTSPGEGLNIVQVLGGASRTAYVGLLTLVAGRGYLQYLRAFTIGGGWRTSLVKVSPGYGQSGRWPGDTIGLALAGGLSGQRRVEVSWGSTFSTRAGPQIYSAVVGGLP